MRRPTFRRTERRPSGLDAPRHPDERGAVLPMTLILTVVMSVVVIAVAGYAMVGLRSSTVANDRTETRVDASNTMSWVVEQFASKQITPDGACGTAPTYRTIAVPAALRSAGTTVTVTCARTQSIGTEPTVHLIVSLAGAQTRTVEALLEVPAYRHGAWLSDYRVDNEIASPDYAAPTTTLPTTTTTTTTVVTGGGGGGGGNPNTTTTLPAPPFVKASPTNGAADQARTLTLSWDPSAGATGYEVCYDTNLNGSCQGGWTSAGTATSLTVSSLPSSTTYEWQVRAVNSQGSPTQADGGTYWTFTTVPPDPDPFDKLSPTTGSVDQARTLTLSWQASTNSTGYEVCYDTTVDGACNSTWTSTGTATSLTISSLAADTQYEWQVRAVNRVVAATEANGGTYWTFTTVPPDPDPFGKLSPTTGSVDQARTLTLSWQASTNSTGYQVCYDTTVNGACNSTWTSAGTATSLSISSLTASTTYEWQVRAVNRLGVTTIADGGTYWTFTTVPELPGAFGKVSPTDGAGNQSITPTLTWQASTRAASYRVCLDANSSGAYAASDCTNVGNVTSYSVTSALATNTTYRWQVEAVNAGGTTLANAGTSWTFTVPAPPAAFVKVSPIDAAGNQSTTPTLTWQASTGAVSYQVCWDTSASGACTGTWTSAGAGTSYTVTSALATGTTYRWQVRALNTNGTTEANGGTYWTFTVPAPPAAFAKLSPTNGNTNQSTTPTLTWAASTGAASYQVCWDTSASGACTGTWTNVGNVTSYTVSPALATSATAYRWQVRAVNANGTTEANGGTYWTFTVPAAPAAFGKVSPTSGATGQSRTPTLTWQASARAASYQVCWDLATNSGACTGTWTTWGGTSYTLTSNLQTRRTYRWQVRAVNANGTTEANSGTYWTFAT